VKGYVGFVADHPTVVRHGKDMEQLARRELENRAVRESHRGPAGDDHADVFDLAERGTDDWRHMQRPLPAWLVARATESETADSNEVELSLFETTRLVGMVKAPKDSAVRLAHSECPLIRVRSLPHLTISRSAAGVSPSAATRC